MKAKASWALAVLFSLFFLSSSIYVSTKRLLWFDELGTLRIAKLPDLATVWKVQQTFMGDSAPMTYHLIIRAVYILSGRDDLSPRFLSAFAMALAMLIVFDCARRLTNGTYGLIAMVLLGASFLPLYGYEGRPYALVVLFTSMALWLWVHTAEDSKPAAIGFGLCICLAVGMHFNSVLAMVPFGLWEVYHWRPWRRPSWKFMAGAVGIFVALVPAVQQMRNASGWLTAYWCPPSIHALMAVIGEMFPSGLLVLAVLGLLAVVAGTKFAPMEDGERLCWLFLSVPFAGFVLAEVATHAFYNRYLIVMLPGVAVAFGCMVSRVLNRQATLAFLLFLCGVAIWPELTAVRKPDEIEPPSALGLQAQTRAGLKVESALMADGKNMIVGHFLIMENSRYYSKRADLWRMYEMDSPELFCKCFSDVCLNIDQMKAHALDMAAIYPSNGLVEDMKKAGFQPVVRMTNPMVVYFAPSNGSAPHAAIPASAEAVTLGARR
jgi:4-amino-4-deoxy-L-arabinose transferase-like glycosyltransferase